MLGYAIFAGNSNPLLSQAISDYLEKPLGLAKVNEFSDGEVQIEIKENVRLKDIYVIQSTCQPVNNNLVELLLMIDAFKRSSAGRITAVIPYFGYARQDKKVAPRVPISASLVAKLIETAGANRIITMELHAGQVQGFFNIPVDNLFFGPLFKDYIKRSFDHNNLVIVSPDAGGVERARGLAKRLQATLAIVDKRRDEPNQAKAMNVIGEVDGKIAVILDDMVDTAGTLAEAAKAIMAKGAKAIHAACTHAILSGKAIENINNSVLESIIIADTIPLRGKKTEIKKKIDILPTASLFGEAISRSHRGDSVTSLFV